MNGWGWMDGRDEIDMTGMNMMKEMTDNEANDITIKKVVHQGFSASSSLNSAMHSLSLA